MKRRKKLKRRNSDEGLNTAYRDSESERSIWDEEDTVYEMIRKRQIIDKSLNLGSEDKLKMLDVFEMKSSLMKSSLQ